MTRLLSLLLLLAPLDAFAFDHAKWGSVLQAHVSGGKVDYAAIEAGRADLDAYVAAVGAASGEQPMGFYLNAYNALVVKALVDEAALPTNVTDLKGFFDARKYTVAGQSMTLNELETKVRKTWNDPRVHFALNCGARSCPPLKAVPFPEDAAALDKVLGDLTSAFLDGSGLTVDDAKKEIQVTKLMDWYKDDFVQKEGSLDAFLKKWVRDAAKKGQLEAALANGYAITYKFYDWKPNGA